MKKCEICGKWEKTKAEIEIYHRGCRLTASGIAKRDRKAEKDLGLPKGLMLLKLKK